MNVFSFSGFSRCFPGTWVPGCGGLMMGGEAVLDLVRRAKEEVK